MNKIFLFYTSEGYCQSPKGQDIPNCQLLGQASGATKAEALHALMNDNPWIADCGYDIRSIQGVEIVG